MQFIISWIFFEYFHEAMDGGIRSNGMWVNVCSFHENWTGLCEFWIDNFLYICFIFLRSELVAKANILFLYSVCRGECQVFFYRTKDQICQYFSFLSKIKYKCWIFFSGSLTEHTLQSIFVRKFYLEYSSNKGMRESILRVLD